MSKRPGSVLVATTTRLISAEEFERHPSSRWAELVDGVVKAAAM